MTVTIGKATANFFDFIISGGGMIGSTLACALGKSPLFKNKKILLIENSNKLSHSEISYSNRVSAINPTSHKLFKSLGIWEHIEASRFQPVRNMKVWGNYSNLSTEFSDSPDDILAYIIENDLIVDSATKVLESLNNVTVLYNKKVTEVILDKVNDNEEKPSLVLQDGSQFSCSILIGADGANSLVRKAMGTTYLSWPYHQTGIVATLNVQTEGPNCTAWQKFLPNGPVALLPLNEEKSSLVWSTSIKEGENLMSLPDDNFVDALNTVLTDSSGGPIIVNKVQECIESSLKVLNFKVKPKDVSPPYISSVEPKSRAKFPLGFGHSSSYCAPHVCIVGDAGHKVHPLAGQGVNLGFHDIICLTKYLTEGMRNGRELGDLFDLKAYEKECLRHNVPIMAGIDFFHRLFVTDLAILKAIGNASFLIADSFIPVKKAMRYFASK